jgi:hypothetical protein
MSFVRLVQGTLSAFLRIFSDFVGVANVRVSLSEIFKQGVDRVQGKASYSSLAALLMPKYFTFKELQLMYEAVLGRPFDQTNFGRRVKELGIIEAIDPESMPLRRPWQGP